MCVYCERTDDLCVIQCITGGKQADGKSFSKLLDVSMALVRNLLSVLTEADGRLN